MDLDGELASILNGKNINKVKLILSVEFKKKRFEQLDNEQLERFIERMKDAAYKGEIF